MKIRAHREANTLSNKLRFKSSRDIPSYMMVLPAIIILLLFTYMPMYGIIIAFKDYSPFKGIMASNWVGFKHFSFLADSGFWRVFKNTIVINAYDILFGFPIPILLAICLNELVNKHFKKIVQIVTYLPHFISWVVVSGIFVTLLNPQFGLVNSLLGKLFGMEPIYFVANSKYFRSVIVFTTIWKTTGMSAIYYLAALTGINPELYESATIDGAGKIIQTIKITLPQLKPIIAVLLLLRIASLTNIGFDQVFLFYNPVVYDVGDVISTYVYRRGIMETQYSLTTAISMTQAVINFSLLIIANKLSRKFSGWSMW